MTRHQKPRFLRITRMIRGWRPDSNPLRRRTDRAEGAIVAGLLALFLASAPLAALTAWHLTYAASLRTERTQQATRHQVPAILLADAPAPARQAHWPLPEAQVLAQWTAPDGTPRTGKITVIVGTRAGTTVPVWADASGRLHSPPLQHVKVTSRALLAATLAPIMLGLLLLFAGWLARRVLDRRRLAGWDADWWVTGPQWTGSR